MHPAALATSLALHAAVAVWLVISLPDFGERLETGDITTVEVVLEEADAAPRLPAEAAPLPERAPTRRAEPAPEADTPSPEPPGSPPAPVAAEREPVPEPADAPEAPAAVDEAAPPAPTPAPAPPEPASPAAAPTAEPAAQIAALSEPPRRRPADVPPSPAAPNAAPETPAGAPRPAADTRREEPEPADEVDALLQSVEELARRVEAEEARPGTGDADVASPTGRLAQLRAQQLGRLIYEQIVGCWNPPLGLEGLRSVGPVEIRAEFRQNGEVMEAEVADAARLATDRTFRSVAESARRAVFNCTPLEGMPGEFYQQWRLVILEFRPDQIAAGG